MTRGAGAERMCTHGREDRIGVGSGDGSDQFAFVGNIQRIEAEDLACAAHLFVDRDRILFEFDAGTGLCGKFVQRTRDTAPCGITQDVNGGASGEHRCDQRMQCGGVACDLRARTTVPRVRT